MVKLDLRTERSGVRRYPERSLETVPRDDRRVYPAIRGPPLVPCPTTVHLGPRGV